ncbi:TIGR02680 family protein [Amycolatopsis vastitatis]|uniref:TIGR02680 family protein n=1 Tax=Amycolatopsis vastitatis TaxID=1905142 RepID=A0A229SNR6_9PSEU|nr:TIGR02680 family protein [Amycolatopsis vastitatis]OXM60503.1 TIGR02680 family protein [Amycolatopsis vastitatis]
MTGTEASAEAVDQALSALLAGEPPQPARSRFQPLRMGLQGIWQYDDQEFVFHQGRLVLRGRNGSGKTKVLEVTSPFLLDANLTARRLDPFGSSARSMRDNLLYADRKHQIGYVWCEYGRLRKDGTPEYLTVGAGMRAQASRSGSPDSWYFLTGLRMGEDFALYDKTRTPASEKKLAELLEPQAVFTTAEAYRAAVAKQLFGLTSERYRSLVELLITLRRPKLSENFGVERLTDLLRDGLPPVDQALVDELANGFDELARDQEDLQDLVKAGKDVDRFLTVYRGYARRMVRYVAAKVRSAVTRYDDVTRDENQARESLAAAGTAVAELAARASALELARSRQHASIRALEQRPEIEQHSTLIAMEKQAAAAARQTVQAEQRLTETRRELDAAGTEAEAAGGALNEAKTELAESSAEAGERAQASGLELEHEMQAERLHTDAAAVRTVLHAVISARRAAVGNARRLLREVEQSQTAFDRAQAVRDDLVARRDESADDVARKQGAVHTAVEGVSTALVSWMDDCREHTWDEADVSALLEVVAAAGEPGAGQLFDEVRVRSVTAEDAILAERAVQDAERRSCAADHAEVAAERERVAAAEELAPPPPLVERRDRTTETLAGSPFWRLVNFAGETEESICGVVEAALLGAGALDAWVMPDGTLRGSDAFDTFLRPADPPAAGVTLAAVLRPVADADVPAAVVEAILRSIAFLPVADPDTGGAWVSADGGWSIGPLTGRTGGGAACYIGAAARAAARERELARLDIRLAELVARAERLDEVISVLDGRIAQVRLERMSCPSDEPVRAARLELDFALTATAALTADVNRATERLDARRTELTTVTGRLKSYGNEHSFAITPVALDRLEEALGDYREAVADIVALAGRVAVLRSSHTSAIGRADRLRSRREAVEAEYRMAATEAAELDAEYQARNALIGADVQRVLAELEQCRAVLRQLDQEAVVLQQLERDAAERLGEAKGRLGAVENDRKTRERQRADAVAEFERTRRLGFLNLAEIFGIETEAVNPTLTHSVDDARRAEQVLREEDSSEKGRNSARNLVDEHFRDLQRNITGPDWRPWGDNEGELFVVRVNHNGADQSVPRLREIIGDEVETRRGYLDDQERKLFAEVLLGRIGEHLRQCRVEAKTLRDRMNRLLAERPTASGLRMRLQWEPDEEAGADVAEAISLLDQQATRFLSDDARDQLVGFLADRVRQVREDDSVGDWRVHLREALDYRLWSRFRLQVQLGAGDRWTPLNDAKHQQGSGGEKAVMLQLPLFVAAAAHYEAAAKTAPRPVYLDEAFAGIDAEMRGSCLRLLTDLDLDFVLASHDEWGFHSEVPGLVTYSLFRDPSTYGVLTTPFIWDGHTRHRLDDPALAWPDPDPDPERSEEEDTVIGP